VKVVAFVNNRSGLAAVETIQNHGDQIVAIVVHPQNSSSHRGEILAATANQNPLIIEAPKLRDQQTIEQLTALTPDIGVSAFFGHILRPNLIDIFPNGIINVHPAYLPYNRGAYPNVWAIVDGTPAGATIHYIDKGVDTGDIIDQSKVEIAPNDTGETLYRKLEAACIELFAEKWPKIAQSPGKLTATQQQDTDGTSHLVKDTEKIDRIDLDANYTAGELINIIRARTFAEHHGAYFEQDGSKYFLRLEIEKETNQDDNS
jgi:methionyl-tRNA formyltransferase